ncbi:bifunctional Protein kinase domain/Protein kinase-like domain superfamily/Protein kinase [Babesia duncani]|uniref:Bifunctional Protein kinase domain/Protein kinase-like domain superfamily/Protein kinase n=1 Tax=Babesia duncani TaxID=323732 RepID=A0AAD9PLG4_9APIC|nr:bifunctional Protein kinase domain/Protein kinase-like domain superfamily/Protein kinase [Babesia duncani]
MAFGDGTCGLVPLWRRLFKREHKFQMPVRRPHYKMNLDSFEMVRTLGTGGFGRVFLAIPKDIPGVKGPCAVKRLKKQPLVEQKQVDHVLSEKRLLGSVNHPFIVNMLGTFKDDYYLYIAMECVLGGDFFTFLRKFDRLSSAEAMFYAAQVTLVFEYLHAHNIIYRDLKPENLLVDRNGYLKLTDFGFAKIVELRTYTLCGTPEYIAPEIILNKGHGKGVDWWTLGILIYEMLVGYPPFYDQDPIGIYKKVLSGKVPYPSYYDPDAKALTMQLLALNPSKRLGTLYRGSEDIKRSTWFSKIDFCKLLNKSLAPPHIPEITDDNDASNFEQYRESTEMPKALRGFSDPFTNW